MSYTHSRFYGINNEVGCIFVLFFGMYAMMMMILVSRRFHFRRGAEGMSVTQLCAMFMGYLCVACAQPDGWLSVSPPDFHC